MIEVIKKTILQAMTTGNTIITGCTGMCEYHTINNTYYVKYGDTDVVIKPDLDIVYNIKFGLKSIVKDIGFFDVVNNVE